MGEGGGSGGGGTGGYGGGGGGYSGGGGALGGAATGARAGGKNRSQNKTMADIMAIAPPPLPMTLQRGQGITPGNKVGAGEPSVPFGSMPGVTNPVLEGWVGQMGTGGTQQAAQGAGNLIGKSISSIPSEYSDLDYAYNKLFGPTNQELPEQSFKEGTPERAAYQEQRAGERAPVLRSPDEPKYTYTYGYM